MTAKTVPAPATMIVTVTTVIVRVRMRMRIGVGVGVDVGVVAAATMNDLTLMVGTMVIHHNNPFLKTLARYLAPVVVIITAPLRMMRLDTRSECHLQCLLCLLKMANINVTLVRSTGTPRKQFLPP